MRTMTIDLHNFWLKPCGDVMIGAIDSNATYNFAGCKDVKIVNVIRRKRCKDVMI